jgi:hypothetical protein
MLLFGVLRLAVAGLNVLAARQLESVGGAPRTRNDADTEENTLWTRTLFQVPAERATIDGADIVKQETSEFSLQSAFE